MGAPAGAYGVELVTLVLVKGVPVTALLLAGGFLLRDAAPRHRSAYWTCGLALLGLLPLVSLHAPALASGPFPFPGEWVRSGDGQPSLGSWILLGWAAGSAVLLGRIGRDVLSARILRRAAVPCRDPGVRAVLREARREHGLRRTVRLRLSETCRVPLVTGWVRPVIVLPASALSWPRRRLRAVLHHEATHVARHDCLWSLVAELLRAIQWPNPFVWWLVARLRGDQELACDAVVVRHGMRPAAYARELLGVARTVVGDRGGSTAALSLSGGSTLAARVRFVLSLDERLFSSRAGGRSVLAVGALALLLSAGVTATSPWRPCQGEANTATTVAPAPATIAAVADARLTASPERS